MIRQIFSINTGRCGSYYLYGLFNHAINVVSHHEPEPNMQREAMVQWNYGDENLMATALTTKLAHIRAVTSSGKVWFCANNTWIKGYGQMAMKHLDPAETGVVVLTRDATQIAESILKGGWNVNAERANRHNVWLLWPGMTRNLTPDCTSNDPLDLALWYVDEIEARGNQFKIDHPLVTYYDVDISELNTMERCIDMFTEFGLLAASSLPSVVGKPTNVGKA